MTAGFFRSPWPCATAGLALVAASGCATTRGQGAACERGPRPAAALADSITPAETLAGDYRLTLVATEGERRGSVARGTLSLRAQPDTSLRHLAGSRNPYLSIPLYGWTDVGVQQVGGVRNGDLATRDPLAPGVRAEEFRWPPGVAGRREAERELSLHLGARGNRRDRAQLDGPYMALAVTELGATQFAGRWEASVGMSSYRAAGYFCAVRAE